jgi:hypothetical protein
MHIKNRSNKRSAANKISLVVIAVLLGMVGYFGFKSMRGLMMLGYVPYSSMEDIIEANQDNYYLASRRTPPDHP